ncbi:FAD-binding oxidoreductase [Streptomyces sp. NBC_00306]|uniref:FAD-binding oxidoreductase n=1 Tax=Streptomyces sp. NBC_00306 TaxID=2975708 RepID=UPI002E2ADC61|nr:FAD-binding oxidoreductase [Streptomyces sp. NBC_00306]
MIGMGQAGVSFRPQDVASLRQSVAGPVLTPGVEGYDVECMTYNLNCRLEPALVVGATSESDVRTAVQFAAGHAMPIAVKSSGHQVVSAARGAMLITTGRMKGMSVDPEARTVRVEAGLLWHEVVAQTADFDLAPIAGSAPNVGVIGYTLGGGQSPLLGRTQGYAADHVRRLNVVTADGELRAVTPSSMPDLFWALLGGKGNFGVVTEIEFDLFPVSRFYGGGIYFTGEHLAQVLEAWSAWVPTVPEEMTSSVGIQRLPDLPVLPEPLRGAFVVHLRIGYLGDAANGERLLAPLRRSAPALLDLVGDKPFASFGEIHLDPVAPMPYVDRSVCLAEFTDKTVNTLVELVGPASGCPLANVEIRALGGALDRQPAVANAVSTRGVPFVVFGFGVGGSDQVQGMREYLAKVMDGLAPWTLERNMMNFLSPDEATNAESVRAAYGPERYRRLSDVKRLYDPSNVFRFNHNVLPS